MRLRACRAGCLQRGPAYKRPDIPAPAEWRDTPPSEDAAVWPSADWWHGFGSQKLDELIAEAQRSNDDLAAAIARVQEADAQARIAGAALLPSLDLGADATRQRAQVSGVGPQVVQRFSIPNSRASYELDFWGKNRALRAAARATAVASRYDKETVALTVISSVATTYFQALEFRDRLAGGARRISPTARKSCTACSLEQTAGIATGLDVAQQETAVALLDAAIPPLQQQFRQTVNALAVLLGKTPESIDVDTGTLNALTQPAGRRGPAIAAAGAPSGRRRSRSSS